MFDRIKAISLKGKVLAACSLVAAAAAASAGLSSTPAQALEYSGQWYPEPITNDSWVYLQPQISVWISYEPGASTMTVAYKKIKFNTAGTSKTTSSHFCDAVVVMRPPASGYSTYSATPQTDSLSNSESNCRSWAGDRLVYGMTQNAGTSWPNESATDFGPLTDWAWHYYTYDVSG